MPERPFRTEFSANSCTMFVVSGVGFGKFTFLVFALF